MDHRSFNSKFKPSITGFTLIELSIVLVIIGLIIGGVLVGRDLIKTAELRNIIKEADSYKTAINAFRIKYNAIPGDMADATSIWGAKTACSDTTDFTRTCNGNNNGKIGNFTSTNTASNESFLFWQHLANSGFIAGRYNGVEGTLGAFDIDIGINTPPSIIANATWATLNQNNSATDVFDGDLGNFLSLGSITGTSSGWARVAVLTPGQTLYIDSKVDDGKPGTGSFRARYWSVEGSYAYSSTTSCTRATASNDFNADYNLTNNTVSCVPQFVKVF